jgi:hypothetical protein
MTHNLSGVNKTAFKENRASNRASALASFRPRRPGPVVSWFKWWESGDRGFIQNRTVLKSQLEGVLDSLDIAGKLTQRRERQVRKLRTIINLGSRSGEGIQLKGPATPVKGTNTVLNAYGKIGRAFKRSIDRVLAKAVRRSNRGGKLRRAFKIGAGF